MFFFHNGPAAVLLLVLTQRLVFGRLEDEKKEAESFFKSIVSSMKIPRIEGIDSVIRSSGDSCAKDIAATLNAIHTQESWALQMLDASSKIQSGIMKGNVQDLGNFDQCVGINGEYNGTNIRGKYCTVSYGIFSSAVCVPSSCNDTQVAEVVEAVAKTVTKLNKLKFEINRVSCLPVESIDFTLGEIAAIFFPSVFVAFIVFCTICGFIKEFRPAVVSPVVHNLAHFSLYTNAIALLSTKVDPGMIPAIQGIRFLCACWVAVGHHALIMLLLPRINKYDINPFNNSWEAIYMHATPHAVDIFFVISGFLTTYLYLKSKQSGNRSNFLMMYLRRYLRLTPCVVAVIAYVTVFSYRIPSGAILNSFIEVYVKPCRKTWWVNLLYLQNMRKSDEMCLLHTWYLAVDMQLFWISPLILYPLYRWPKLGLGILSLFLVGSVVTPPVLLAANGYSNAAALSFSWPDENYWINFRNFYVAPHIRSCPYFVGALMGYDAFKRRRVLTQVNVAINWAVSCIIIVLCALAAQYYQHSEYEYNLSLEIAFALLIRPFWAIAFAWIIYACTFGYGGPVTKFLSLPIFMPLSRLSYCFYLVNSVIQGMETDMTETPHRFSFFLMFNDFWGDLVSSIAVAFGFSLFFEVPVLVLDKMLKKHKSNATGEPRMDVEGRVDNKPSKYKL